MFKKTKAFQLKEKWEQKLNIKYDLEIEYYKRFCGLPYKYKVLFKNTDRYNDFEDITYDNWKCHILKTIEKFSLEELKNYSRFLNQQYRDYDIHFTLAQTIFAPLILYLVTILLSPLASNLNVFDKDIYNVLLYLLFFLWDSRVVFVPTN